MNDASVHPSSRAPIRVLLVEDHSAFRQALALTFAMEPDIQVIGQARTITVAATGLAEFTHIRDV